MAEISNPPPPESHSPNPSPMEPSFDAGEPISSDPLLQSGSFIDAVQNEAELETPPPQQYQSIPVEGLGSGEGIAAEPISFAPPAGGSAEQPRPMKRNVEEMSKRPAWLPENWEIDLRIRASGATAGSIDRYYINENGKRFRSKKEVEYYMKTGKKLKKQQQNSAADATPSEDPGTKKEKKSRARGKGKGKGKGKKPAALKFDFKNPPPSLTWVCSHRPEETWVACVDNVVVPAARQREWAAAFTYLTETKEDAETKVEAGTSN